ncbi:uncharacterized protein LOC120281356 isoform X3 [Dioscorea cayenensis subsp. rotundata]|uniref:Uncharacterized protein LOC120281356 isoform X3 n=1 Tax=Dioscorea cayennensis subsp. rotundata TaxID=55577 RepID=A0AB40CVN6_DIOCR|nr:uncharacterized protein LOC120281356 isoform X3 [Dioscorea cayenensis subsp. rotundata]
MECDKIAMSKNSACCSLEHVVSVGNYGRGRSPGRVSGEVELENTELQLAQVSKGAQKLKEMIDSWSKVPNVNRRSKDVARDLLRSAIVLQESLSMLAKLQEASKHMSKVKRNKVANEVEFEEISSSRRFSIDGSLHRLQEPRLSVDGSSKGCADELRKIIGDSLFRQNLLSRPSEDEMAQSSRSLRFNPDDEFKEPFLQTKKVKQPNLIAKLMGLDEVPCDAIQREHEKNLSSMKLPQKHHIFYTEHPKMRKAQVLRENTDLRKRTLQDIIERSQRTQLKGFLRNGQVEDTSNSSMVSKLSASKRYDECFNEDDEVPPIVIVKPAKLSNREKRDDKREEPQVQKTDTKSAQSIKEEKVLGKGRVLSDKTARKEATSIEKTKTEFFHKVKELDGNKQQQKKEAFTNNKMFDDWKKPSLNTKKLEVKNDIKVTKTAKSLAKTSKTSPKSEEKVTTAVAKNHLLSSQAIRQQKYSLNSMPKHIVENSISSLKERKKTAANPVKTSTTTTAAKAAKNCKKRTDGKEVKLVHRTNIILPADNQKAYSKDDKTEYEENHCEAKQNLIAETAEAIHVPKKNKPISDDMKCILLTSQSFFMQAQELINSKHQPIYRRKNIEFVDTTNAKLFLDCANEVMSRKRLQNELSRHPMLQACIWSPTLYHSLDHLLQEISNEFEKLTSYNSADHSATAEDDDLYVRLEKDLQNKDMLIDSMWDVGWLNLCCVEEVDEVVGRVEKEIIDWLIEELVLEVL